MVQQYRLDGTLLTQRIRMNTDRTQGVVGLPSSAWYGESQVAGIRIDDPLGELDVELRSIHTFTADETASVGTPRQFSGWLLAKRISRGPYRDGPGRIFDCDIYDQNWLFHLEAFRASSAKRPEESDLARIAWVIASGPMSGTPLHDNGRLNLTDNPVNFGPADYIPQYPVNVFESVAAIAGKNFYAYWDQYAEEISGHYDLIGEGPECTLAISNVRSESDATTFYPFLDASMEADPAQVVTGVLLGYLGGQYVYGRNQVLIDEMSPTEFSPDEFRRDYVHNTDRIGKAATASATVQSMLRDLAREKDTIRCAIRVPATQVGLVEAGMLIPVKFTHMPGYEAQVSVPIIRVDKAPTDGRRDMWDVHLELSNSVKVQGPGGGDPGDFPFEDTCDVANAVIVQSKHASVFSPASNPSVNVAGASWTDDGGSLPTEDNIIVCGWELFGNQTKFPGDMDGWTQLPDSAMIGVGGSGAHNVIYWKVASAAEDDTPMATGGDIASANLSKSQNYLIELAGIDALDTVVVGHSETETLTPGVLITPTSGKVAIILTFLSLHSHILGTQDDGTELYHDDNLTGGGNPCRHIMYDIVGNTSGSYDVNRTLTFDRSWSSVTMAFTCSGSGTIPGAGVPVRNEHVADGDGTTTDFATRFPYVPGTLQVFVDGVPIILGLTEIDPAAGTFSLDFAPLGAIGDTRAEEVTAGYLVAVGGSGL